MSRTARPRAPDAAHHVICRFVDGRFHFDDALRKAYCDRLAAGLARTDWLLLAYALMSSHVHLDLLPGTDTLQSWLHPVNTGFAIDVNRQRRRAGLKTLGPVFGDRPTTRLHPLERAGEVIAYLHNNPCRAGIVTDPSETTWTTHQQYTGRAVALPWVSVGRGLALAGFDETPTGRRMFHDFVLSRLDATAAGAPGSLRTTAEPRRGGNAPRLVPNAARQPLTAALAAQCTPAGVSAARETVCPDAVVAAVCRSCALDIAAVAGPGRNRRVVRARAVTLWAGRSLGLTDRAMCETIGISPPSGSELLARTREAADLRACALEIAAVLGAKT